MNTRPYYHWRRLIEKYQRKLTLYVQGEGTYRHGIFVPGEECVYTIEGAIISKQRGYENGDGGNYESEAQILYTLRPIPYPLERAEVEHRDHRYHIVLDRDDGNAPLTGVFVYNLKRVEKFEKGGGETW